MLLLAAHSLAHAGALGPGVPVRQVVPPPVVLAGISSLEVRIDGPHGAEVGAEIGSALLDPARVLNTSGAEVGQALVQVGTEVAAGYVSGLVGGLGGKAVSGLTRGVGAMVAEEIDTEPLVLADGLRTDVFRVVPRGGDAALVGTIAATDETRESTKKEPLLYDDGTFVKDEYGNVMYQDIPCRSVSVSVTLSWRVEQAGAVLHQDQQTRSASDERCGAELSSLATASSLQEPLFFGWGPGVAATIAPSWRHDRLPMDREPHLVPELQQVRAGAYDEALCGLRHAVSWDAADAAAWLDQGVIHEALGRYDEAEQAYDRALAAGASKPAGKALTRVRERRSQVATLTSAYGLTFAARPFDPAACPALPDGRRAEVRKPTTLWSDDGAAVVELEKGMRLFVTDESGARWRVALTDGTVGLVEAKTLR